MVKNEAARGHCRMQEKLRMGLTKKKGMNSLAELRISHGNFNFSCLSHILMLVSTVSIAMCGVMNLCYNLTRGHDQF